MRIVVNVIRKPYTFERSAFVDANGVTRYVQDIMLLEIAAGAMTVPLTPHTLSQRERKIWSTPHATFIVRY